MIYKIFNTGFKLKTEYVVNILSELVFNNHKIFGNKYF